jgi:hypothetical protein
MMIVLVFDPLAVLMLIAANWQMRKDKEEKETPVTEAAIAPVADVDAPEPAKTTWSEQLFKKQEPLPDEAKSIIHKFFHKEDVKVEDKAKVEVVPPDTIVVEVENLQQVKGIDYDSAGRRITP